LTLVAELVAKKKTAQQIGRDKRAEFKKLRYEQDMLNSKNK